MASSKQCFKCHKKKPLSSFYQHPQMSDGHLNKCKDCAKKDATKHRNKNLEKVRAYDRERAKAPERTLAAAAVTAAWRQEDRRRQQAHSAVARAIRSGELVRTKCERCERLDTHAHHDDYDKPLKVRWLCPPHHKKRHKELSALTAKTR